MGNLWFLMCWGAPASRFPDAPSPNPQPRLGDALQGVDFSEHGVLFLAKRGPYFTILMAVCYLQFWRGWVSYCAVCPSSWFFLNEVSVWAASSFSVGTPVRSCVAC